MTQNESILQHLRNGKPLNPLQALNNFGCFRLASRIKNLRDKGHHIESKRVTVGGKTFAQYRIPINAQLSIEEFLQKT